MDTNPGCSYCGERKHLNGCPIISLTRDVDHALWAYGKADRAAGLEPRTRQLSYLIGYDPRLARERSRKLMKEERTRRATQSPPSGRKSGWSQGNVASRARSPKRVA